MSDRDDEEDDKASDFDFAEWLKELGHGKLNRRLSKALPKLALPGGVFYVGDSGELVDEDPRQQKLPMPRVLQPTPIKFPGGNGNGGKGDAS